MTPLKKWATVNLIAGVINISISFVSVTFAIMIYSAEIEAMRKYVTFGLLLV